MDIRIEALTPARVDDFFTFFVQVAFRDHPEWGCGCYCCFYHATGMDDWDTRTPADNRAWAREMILAGGMRGLLAYDGDTPVGWCHYDLIANLPGTRAFTEGLASDDPQSAAVVCFTVAQGWRSRGVATKLLSAALADLEACGVTRVEAYPVLSDESPEHNYPGPLALYEKLGFTQVRQTKGRALVEKRL